MSAGVPILMYHKVARAPRDTTLPGHYVRPDVFESHIRWLSRRGYRTSSVSSLFEGETPDRIAVTFDDGYENFLTNALPTLRRYDAMATVFAVAERIGGVNDWDTKDGDVEERLMSLPQLREAVMGGTEIGSHSATHADLAAIALDDAKTEIDRSRTILRGLIGAPIDVFCYPYGRETMDVRRLVREAGYRYACSTAKGMNDSTTDPMALRRINVRQDTSLPVLIYKLWRERRRGV